jgi:hypothetical protein
MLHGIFLQGLITVAPGAVLIKAATQGPMPVVASAYNNATDPSQRRSAYAQVCHMTSNMRRLLNSKNAPPRERKNCQLVLVVFKGNT